MTNIQVSKETREELKYFGKVGESYEDVVTRLIELAKRHRDELSFGE
jgi:predicted CopG family antitoxin